jgi:hypothetical protein
LSGYSQRQGEDDHNEKEDDAHEEGVNRNSTPIRR